MLCLLHAEFDKAVYSVGPKGFFSVVVLCYFIFSSESNRVHNISFCLRMLTLF